MTPRNSWRAFAIFASVGWALTVLAWSQSSSEPEVRRNDQFAQALRQPSRPREASARRAVSQRRPFRLAPTETPVPNLEQLRDEVRNEVLDEIEEERAERRQRRSEHHLTRLLEEVAAFGREHDLDADTVAALESSMGTMHDRLEELRPSGPPGPGGPPPEVMHALETSFEQFEIEVGETLDDPDVTALFTERMTPRPLRDRR